MKLVESTIYTTTFLHSACWWVLAGASPGGIPHFFWATFVNPTFGPTLATSSTGLPSGGAPQAVPLGVVLEVPGQVHDLVGVQGVLALLLVRALALDLVGGHLTLLLVGHIALLVAHGSHLVPHCCTVRAGCPGFSKLSWLGPSC